MQYLIFGIAVIGSYALLTAQWPGVYRPAAKAMKARMPKAMTQTQVVVNSIARYIRPMIEVDPIKRLRLAETMKSLGHSESPEDFQSKAWAQGLLFSFGLSWLVLLSVPLGMTAVAIACIMIHNNALKKLEKEMASRRQRIERELPQLAGTIQQSLQSTHDVVAILTSYRKICGPALATEIDRTLNDMMTGNAERALRALESRVASPKLGQLTRGLVSVLRGDDQRVYFEMLAAEYRKQQNEEVAQELLKRPEQLYPNMGMLFGCLIFMIIASLGVDLVNQMSNLLG